MDVLTYAIVSAGIIMFWHMAFNTNPKDFGLFQMIGIFVLGGAMGYYMHSIETGLLMSIVLSLIFI
jgi:hypothetical protein